MKIQSQLILDIGGIALITAAVALCSIYFTMSYFLKRLHAKESAYSSEIVLNSARASVKFESRLLDEYLKNLFSRMANIEKNIRLNPPEKQSLIQDFLEKNPIISHFITFPMRKNQTQPSAIPDVYSLSGEKVELSPDLYPDLFRYLAGAWNEKQPYLYSLVSSSSADHTASLWCVLIRHSEKDPALIHVELSKLKNDFLMNGFSNDAPASRTYFLYNGTSILTKTSAFPEPEVMGVLRRMIHSDGVHARNVDGKEFHFRNEARQGYNFCLAAAELSIPLYDSASNRVYLVSLYRYAQNTPGFFYYLESRFIWVFCFACGMTLLGLVLVLPAVLIAAKQFSRPITDATKFADALAREDFPAEPLKMTGAYELMVLGKSLNFMRDRLSCSIAKLKRSHERESDARRSAESANALKSDLLSRLSLELRNPLNSIKGFSALVLKDMDFRKEAYPPETRHFLQCIHDSSENLNDIVGALIELAKFHQEHPVIHPEPIETSEVMKNLMDSTAAFASSRSIQLESHYTPAARKIFTDFPILQHTLSLIAVSLVRLLPPGGKVQMGYGGDNHSLFFWMQDVFPAGKSNVHSLAEACRLYEQTREENAFSSGETSSILNLMIARDNAKLLGADLLIELSGKNSTKISVVFSRDYIAGDQPVTNNMTSQTASVPAVRKNGRKKRTDSANILIADCNELNQKLVSMILRDTGSHFDFAFDGKECMEFLSRKKYDILVLDIDCVFMNGEEVLHLLKADRHHDTLIILLAAYLEEDTRRHYLSLGVKHCLLKPINIDQLYSAVRSG